MTALAASLASYPGSMVIASHDRFFCRSIITASDSEQSDDGSEAERKLRTFVVRGQGEIDENVDEDPMDAFESYLNELEENQEEDY